jgi:hypothetical protein
MLSHRTTGSKSAAQIFTAWQNIHTHVAMAEFTLYIAPLCYCFIKSNEHKLSYYDLNIHRLGTQNLGWSKTK